MIPVRANTSQHVDRVEPLYAYNHFENHPQQVIYRAIMSIHSTKRQRSNTNGDAAPAIPVDPSASNSSPEEMERLVHCFDDKTVRELLVSAALVHPTLIGKLRSKQREIIQVQSAKAINFNHYSQEVLEELTSGYGLKRSRQYEISGKVYRAITQAVGEIRVKCPPYSSFETKESALETLRHIGENICYDDNGTLGSEVIKSFQYDSCLDDTMLEIVNGMTEEERQKMRTSSERFVEKTDELIRDARSHGVFEKLGVVLKTLVGGDTMNHNKDDEEDPESKDSESEDSESEEGEEIGETRYRMIRRNRLLRNRCGGFA